MVNKKTISIITPCYNEEDSIYECYQEVKKLFDLSLARFNYEHIFIDNCSNDGTVDILRRIAHKDSNVKVIVNSRNFGLSKSPYHAILNMTGDAAIFVVADLQTPLELIPIFIEKWEGGIPVVIGVRSHMKEGGLIKFSRNIFYKLLTKFSNIEQIEHFTGYGLFDKKIIEVMRTFNDPSPYFRGIISEIGFDKCIIKYDQGMRKHGKSRHNFSDLLDLAILALTSYSSAPLRIMTFVGALLSMVSFLVGLFYLAYKILNWYSFNLGLAPLLISTLFFASIQILFLGLMGEYLKLILDHVRNRPLVVEKERINF